MERFRRVTDILPPKISDRIVLAVAYYWFFFQTRNGLDPEFQPDFSSIDPKSDTAPLQAIFAARMQAESSGVDIAKIILAHPERTRLLPNLSDSEVTYHCGSMFQTFEDGWIDDLLHKDPDRIETPEEFSLGKADDYLYESVSMWKEFEGWKDRQAIIKMVLEERLGVHPSLKGPFPPQLTA